MTVLKCKMCGGDLNVLDEQTVCECEYCGTRQTVPKADDEKKLKLFARAGRLLRACEFDKAAGVYETIVADFDQEAEAYWGLILCKYGIEYVDDPATGKKIPTCHRSSFDGVLDDANFDLVMENADAIARPVYRAEAKEIERLRKGILEVSAQEEPFDVFICYKETDEQGDRTVDSLIAQDVYTALTERGYRVFFSRISLEDKLGQEYEPYIFAALHSARVMLAFGTSYENYDAVWVKNEWSRFLSLIARGEKKTLIPCYKDLDAYDMPKEFQRLQAQDMGKVGAMQDLLRGVEKIIGKKAEPTQPAQQIVQQIVQGGGPNVAALLERGNMALEDQEWEKAKEYFDQVLSMDAKCGEAYLGLAMAEAKCRDRDRFAAAYIVAGSPLRGSKNVARARMYNATLETWSAEIEKKGHQADQIKIRELEKIRKQCETASGLLSAGGRPVWRYTVGVKTDGTVLADGSNIVGGCDVDNWRDIVAVSVGNLQVVGLKKDGTVLAAKYLNTDEKNHGQYDVGDWRDIVAVSAGKDHTVGLKADGTVITTKFLGEDKYYYGQCDVGDWRDIVAVSAGGSYTVGLRADGTVVATKYLGKDKYYCGQCDVGDWRDIVAVSAGGSYTIGLKADGTVVATKYIGEEKYYHGQCDVGDWRDIVAVSAGGSYAVGLKADGTVVATKYIGDGYNGVCDVGNWRDIVAVYAGSFHTVGLKKDGTVLATKYLGLNVSAHESNVGGWKLFEQLDTLETERIVAAERAKAAAEKVEAERKAAAERAEAERKVAEERAEAQRRADAEKAEAQRRARIATLNQEKADLQTELSNLRGLFTGKRRREIEERLAEIDAELKKLG